MGYFLLDLLLLIPFGTVSVRYRLAGLSVQRLSYWFLELLQLWTVDNGWDMVVGFPPKKGSDGLVFQDKVHGKEYEDHTND